MIRLTEGLPEIFEANAALVKIRCLYDCYKNDKSVLFWVQDEASAIISMTDGNMVIYNSSAELSELSQFVSMMSPCCIFSDMKTLRAIGRLPDEVSFVLRRKADASGAQEGEYANSRMLYDALNVPGLNLPDYPSFAVDYCRRLNSGAADYFYLDKKCAAISLNSGDYAIMSGIASSQAGYGSVALNAILEKNYGREFLVCCRPSVRGFYEKNGFTDPCEFGYWVK